MLSSFEKEDQAIASLRVPSPMPMRKSSRRVLMMNFASGGVAAVRSLQMMPIFLVTAPSPLMVAMVLSSR